MLETTNFVVHLNFFFLKRKLSSCQCILSWIHGNFRPKRAQRAQGECESKLKSFVNEGENVCRYALMQVNISILRHIHGLL